MKNFSLEEYLKNLEEMINTDSNSMDPAGVDNMAALMEKKYLDLGLSVKKHRFDERGGYCLEVRNCPESEDIDVLMVGHMDTVLPIGYTKEHPFYHDGKTAHGPGVLDMKSGVLNMYYVVKQLIEDKTPLKLCLALNSDEEISSRYSNPWISELARKSKCGLVFEPTPHVNEVVDSRPGLARFNVEFKGKYAHSGANPWDGASAVHEMAYWITCLVPLNNYSIGTSVNAGLVSGGIGANTVAEAASMSLDVRFSTIEEYNRIKEALDGLQASPFVPGVTAEIKRVGFRPPMIITEHTAEFVKIMTEAAKECGIDLKSGKMGGGSDGNFMAFEGCPVIDSVGPSGKGAHGINELINIDSIEPRIDLAYKTVTKLVGTPFINRKL